MKAALKSFALFTGKHLYRSLFLIKSLKGTNFNKFTTSHLTFTFKYSEAWNNISDNCCGVYKLFLVYLLN